MEFPFIDVALSFPSKGTFQYALLPETQAAASIGSRVWVSVRARKMVGYIVGGSHEKVVADVRPIDSLIDLSPILSPDFLKLTRWMSDYYACSWGQAIDSAMPAPFKKGKFVMKSRSKKSTAHAEIESPTDYPLTPRQNEAYETIKRSLTARIGKTFLLHGITGSGKTEVYMHLIRDLLKEDRGSIVLVPEISLTPQTLDRFYSRFGDCLAVIHSRISQARRVEEWHRVRSGQARVVIGARSAIFSPVKDLGLIVIDEEQETSYKQEETPRYHTREVAKERSLIEGAALVLGSATPSLEAYFDAKNGTSYYLSLPDRIEKRPLPEVRVIDMRRRPELKKDAIFSPALRDAVLDSLSKKEQVMLFLNRRGFSTYLHCSSCGYVASCENCRVALAYHRDRMTLLCHVCHYRAMPPKLCPGCQKSYLHYFGMGTQKVEEEAKMLFLGARIGRMDSDTTSRKNSHEEILRAFKRKELDILIGTQMIAKGHDFPNVSLIGVISADTALHLPDFRASERTFSLLTQVAGRAGRGDIPGRVVIQTLVPTHYSIQSAKDHDYDEFYKKEIVFRQELQMPPYSHLVQLIFAGKDEKEVLRKITEFGKLLRESADRPEFIKVAGPAPCLISKEKGLYRWNLFVKGPSIPQTMPYLESKLGSFDLKGMHLAIDVDPL